jgi:serine O-acetyltransferase
MNQIEKSFLKNLSSEHEKGWIKKVNSTATCLWLENLLALFFPKNPNGISDLEKNWMDSKMKFSLILKDISTNNQEIDSKVNEIFTSFPTVYKDLQKDANAILEADPAADSLSEIINSYPGFYAIAVYRISNLLAQYEIEILPRILSEYAHAKTGIDIHPKATIDVPFIIDHGTGIVIGETAVIGKNVSIYQGVTLGAMLVEKSMQEKKRHPTVENNVVIYANATILGGSTVIGNHTIIGGNAFITKSVNPYSIVMQNSKNIIVNQIQENQHFNI